METVHLPSVNAALNGTSALFLLCGLFFIRRKNVPVHRFCMAGALVASALFLLSYLIHHFQAGATRFMGAGWTRPLYFSILLSHTVLAVAILPLILVTFGRALRGRFDLHARLARWTWPLWMYVSVTGIAIYFMLYHL